MNILEDVLDLHVHSFPDVKQRKMTDIELCQAYQTAGMGGCFLKNHFTSTVARASIAEQIFPPLKIQGGVVLNDGVGGLNPVAAETCGKMGGTIVWFPTLDAKDYLDYQRSHGQDKKKSGISVFEGENNIIPEAETILKIIAEYDMVLGTGHLAHNSLMPLLRRAKECGVRKILMTHINHPVCTMNREEIEECKAMGVFFELCYHPIISGLNTWENALELIDWIGKKQIVLTTDLGQTNLEDPVTGMKNFITGLLQRGITADNIHAMSVENPRKIMK